MAEEGFLYTLHAQLKSTVWGGGEAAFCLVVEPLLMLNPSSPYVVASVLLPKKVSANF